MTVETQYPDGSWGPAVPEPMWRGFRLRVAVCECDAHFRKCGCYSIFNWRGLPRGVHAHTARERYQEHFVREHIEYDADPNCTEGCGGTGWIVFYSAYGDPPERDVLVRAETLEADPSPGVDSPVRRKLGLRRLPTQHLQKGKET